MKRVRFFSIFLTAALLFTACFAVMGVAHAANLWSVGSNNLYFRTYGVSNQKQYSTNNLAWVNYSGRFTITGTTTTNTVTVLSGEHSIELDNVSVDVSGTASACAFKIDGSAAVNMTLIGDNELISGAGCAGMQIAPTAKLTIVSPTVGSLSATGGEYAAGIGGGDGGNNGTVIIQSGHITAQGGTGGAGIGGGRSGSGGSISIQINGGSIKKAQGGWHAAGIGGGNSGSGGKIDITSGWVAAALGGTGGAGIGGGYDGSGETFNIKGCTIALAQGGENAAGIGGGSGGAGGTIDITSCTIKSALGGVGGAGIGGGPQGGDGKVTITDADVNEARGGENGAGIGGGDGPWSGTVKIDGGTIKSFGGDNAAGIGSGSLKTGSETTGTVEIYAGTIEAVGGSYGAGIGGGYYCTGGVININGGTIALAQGGADGAGIGGGILGTGGVININGGIITLAQGGFDSAGIGGGSSSSGGDIYINDGTIVLAQGGQHGAGIGGGSYGKGGCITVKGGVVKEARGGKFGAGIGGGQRASADTVSIVSGDVTAYGGESSAGIGGGLRNGGGTVKISGGRVRATGGESGAGIGGGLEAGIDGVALISGGTVEATGGANAVGIGGGKDSLGGRIEITGGSVKALGSAGSINGTVKNGSGDDAKIVILTAITIPEAADGTPVGKDDIPSDYVLPDYYGMNDVVTIGSEVYLYYISPHLKILGGVSGEDYEYTEGLLSVKTGTALEIEMTPGFIKTTSDRIYVEPGVTANITLSGVNIDLSATEDVCAFHIANGATVNLTLKDDTENVLASGTNHAGLEAGRKSDSIYATLTINGGDKGTGKLTATGGANAAGIGGGNTNSGGVITVKGCEITAQGGANAAGIGGGNRSAGGVINIKGGTIALAQGGANAAGIGGGKFGSGGNIEITGGTIVLAQGGEDGAGIGSGSSGKGGCITIKGGVVKEARGGKFASGIGGGQDASVDTISIESGDVTAYGGYDAAGIGGGWCNSGGTVKISGGRVRATGGDNGAGIGSGIDAESDSVALISGGTVEAMGGANAVGIGGGEDSLGDRIEITGGSVKALGSAGGITSTVKNGSGDDAEIVVLTAITIPETEDGTPVGKGDIPSDYVLPDYYGMNDVVTIGSEVYFYYIIKTATPETDNALFTKSASPFAAFELTNTYKAETVWKVYDALTDGNEITDVTASFDGDARVLTLTCQPDIPMRNYFVSAKEPGEIESDRLALRVVSIDFNIIGGVRGVDYEYTETEGLLSVKTGTALEIGMASGVIKTTYNRIYVEPDVTANITLSGVNIDLSATEYVCAFHIANGATVNLTLKDDTENTLTSGVSRAGIEVGRSSSGVKATLVIGAQKKGNGKLTATSASDGAGIGGGDGYEEIGSDTGAGGVITINGGIIVASGGKYGAGIGGGFYGGSGGDITVNGGHITATGGVDGAGIGGGLNNSGGVIVITGGTIEAIGDFYGAGIGGSRECGADITISGGSVFAKSNGAGAGIGGGCSSANGNLKITGGYVHAIGGSMQLFQNYVGGAGIGGGAYGNGESITIEGGTVIAQGGYSSSGIGGGIVGNGGTVIISGGSVKAIGSDGSSDIGRSNTATGDGTLKNGAGEDVSLVKLTLSGADDSTPVSNFATKPDYFRMNDVKTIQSDLYFYLPADREITEVTTGGATPARYIASEAITGDSGVLNLGASVAFKRSPFFDIPSGQYDTDIAEVNVSTGVSGGTPPYAYSLENAPEWLTIESNSGIISGRRPSSSQEVTTATVKVADSSSPAPSTASVTINIGAVSAEPTSAIVPVQDITDIPTAAVTGIALELSGKITPDDPISQKTVVWEILDAGTTGATLSGDNRNILTATAAGTISMRARVPKGLTEFTDYAKDFTVTATDPASRQVGDVDDNGLVNLADAQTLLDYISQAHDFTGELKEASDVFPDDVINTKDAVALLARLPR